MSRKLIANQLRLPSGKIIRSLTTHDYVTCVEDGVEYMVDGGTSYVRRSVAGEDCCVYSDDPIEIVRNYLTWGTYGKDGKDPLKLVLLCNLSNSHIEAILKTQIHMEDWYRECLIKELKYRENLGFEVED
jgi:hypothetical protein